MSATAPVLRSTSIWFSPRLVSFYSVAGGLLLWEILFDLIARTSLYESFAIGHFLSSPVRIVQTFIEFLSNGELLEHCYFSLLEFVYGYLLAVAVGIPLGALMALRRKLNHFLDPWVSCLYATPRVALAPLVMIWFGLGIIPNSLIVFLGAVFPILLNTYTGIKSVQDNLVEVARAFGGSPLQIFFKVMLPDAIPAIMAGLRLAVGRAVIGVVVAEWFGAEAGLGYMVYFYAQLFQPGPVFVGIVILVIFGHLAFICLERIQNWISPWHKLQGQAQIAGMEME